MIKINEKYIGTIKSNMDGSAYFICNDLEKNLYINKYNRSTALHLDEVEIEVIQGKRKHLDASVTKIIKRFRKEFTGELELKGNDGIIICSDHKMTNNIRVNPKGYKDGEKVLVKIVKWSKSTPSVPFGEIIKTYGKSGEHTAEINSIIDEFDLPIEFPSNVLAESSEIDSTITKDEIKKRVDFRKHPTFTIDPTSSKDFDDAVSIKQTKDGKFEIGIHIADVTHYLKPGSELDKEAYKRGTSVYLVDRVIPMLPEVLSNDVCSLNPGVDKLTFSVTFLIDRIGKIHSVRYNKGIINSNQRFTYDEVQTIIDSTPSEIPSNLQRYSIDIKALDFFAKMLREDRIKSGALIFDRKEFQFDIEDDVVNEIKITEQMESQQLIEEFMLLANKSVSEYITKKSEPMIYRVHDEPKRESLLELRTFLNGFDYKIKMGKQTKDSINTIIQKVKNTPLQNMINTLITRTMSKAVYTTDNIGHYGLGFDTYSHFTSPIRRYSDVLAHRLLDGYMNGGSTTTLVKLESQSEHLSSKERAAAKAERSSERYKQVEFMLGSVSHIKEVIVTSFTKHVIFLEFVDTGISCVLPMGNFIDGYVLDKSKFYLKHKDDGNDKVNIGDTFLAKIVSVDLSNRRIEIEVA